MQGVRRMPLLMPVSVAESGKQQIRSNHPWPMDKRQKNLPQSKIYILSKSKDQQMLQRRRIWLADLPKLEVAALLVSTRMPGQGSLPSKSPAALLTRVTGQGGQATLGAVHWTFGETRGKINGEGEGEGENVAIN
jgi:hypothetical protein